MLQQEGWDDAAQWAWGTRVGLQDTYGSVASLGSLKPPSEERKTEKAQVMGHSPPSLQFLPGNAPRLGYHMPSAQAWDEAGRPVSPQMLPADTPGAQLTSVMSSVYRRVNRCLQRESLNFDIRQKDVNTSPQKINPEY